jgi:hypothetical protein
LVPVTRSLPALTTTMKVAGIDVRSEFWFVFAAQSECHFAGNTSEDFVRRVNHEPIALDFMALSGKSFHVDFLKIGVNAQMVVPLLLLDTDACGLCLIVFS